MLRKRSIKSVLWISVHERTMEKVELAACIDISEMRGDSVQLFGGSISVP